MYALILIVFIQSSSGLTARQERIDAAPKATESFRACDDAGQMLRGPLMAETDPARQYAWQDYQCVKLEGL
jgi:hypothetical protein